jgi:RimJ/RimL family protein N-acetyltransferase
MVSSGIGPLQQASSLVPFTGDLLPAVQPWFTNPEVRHWLGGPAWPERELRLIEQNPGGEFRGRQVLAAHSWVLLDGDAVPVAKIGGDIYDRWTRYSPELDDKAIVLSSIDEITMGLTYVVDPRRQRQGFGSAAVRALLDHPATTEVRLFVAGIDAANTASRRFASSSGFVTDDSEPDFEDTIYYFYRR